MAKKQFRIRNQSKNPWTFPVYEDTVRTEEKKRVINTGDGEPEVVHETVEIPRREVNEEIVVPPTYKLDDPQYSEPFDKETLEKLQELPKFESLMNNGKWFAIEPYEE